MLKTIRQLSIPRKSMGLPAVALLVVVLSLGLASGALAQSPTVNMAAARQELAPTGVFRLGILIGTNTTRDPKTGELSGVGVDLGNELARRLGVSFQPSAYNVARDMVADMHAGKIDAGIWVIDPGNAQQFDFSRPYLVDSMTYAVRADSPIRTAADADKPGVRIATTAGSVFYSVLQRQLKQATLVGIDFTDQMPELQSGQVDAFAFIRSRLVKAVAQQPGLRVVNGEFGVDQQAITLLKGRPNGLAFVNQALGDMLASGLIQQSVTRAGLQGLQIPVAGGQAAPAMPTRSGSLLSRLPLEIAAGVVVVLILLLAAGLFGLRARSRMVRG